EKTHSDFSGANPGSLKKSVKNNGATQLNFFELNDPMMEEIKDKLDKLDLNTLTPIEAMMKLAEFKKLLDQ
ncbi:MAG: hypothetical protein JKX74_04395, partial [Flavobacteriales bacterium]|nr:hypothetical protein [Flavobacteriales bacterium]